MKKTLDLILIFYLLNNNPRTFYLKGAQENACFINLFLVFSYLTKCPEVFVSKQIPEPILLLELKRRLGNIIGRSSFKSQTGGLLLHLFVLGFGFFLICARHISERN